MKVIYKITSPSNSVYIGQAWNFENRIKKYKNLACKYQRAIFNSINKYGFDNHKFEIIHELPNDITQDTLDNYEQLYK